MPRRKFIGKDKKVGIKLSPVERKLILGDPIHIHEKLAHPIRATPTGAPILLTLDDLEDLGGYVAAEANHTTDRSSEGNSTQSSRRSRNCWKPTQTKSRSSPRRSRARNSLLAEPLKSLNGRRR